MVYLHGKIQYPGQRARFWDGQHAVYVAECNGDWASLWAFMKTYGGDRTKWAVLASSNQGWFNLPIPDWVRA